MYEIRGLRASFTATLGAICRRLDAKPSAAFGWKHPLVHVNCSSEIDITSLWAVGSYARGAPACGDLDLVAEYVLRAGPPPTGSVVLKAMFGSPRDVSLYVGTPAVNTSSIDFPEAIPIWCGHGYDWQGAIAGIVLDASAGHYARLHDRIPLRPSQLGCSADDLMELLTLEDQRIIRWKFVPFGVTTSVKLMSKDELELSRVVDFNCGLKTRRLLPHLMQYLREAGGWTKPCLRAKFDITKFGIGGAKVLVGRPAVPVYELDSLATSELLVVPHASARGPNGVWIIERGARHPLVLAVGQLRAWGLFGEDGQPSFAYLLSHLCEAETVDYSTAREIDLFTSSGAANRFANEIRDVGDPLMSARELSPRELLSCLSRVDVAAINNTDYAVTRRGRVSLGCIAIASTQELLQALAG